MKDLEAYRLNLGPYLTKFLVREACLRTLDHYGNDAAPGPHHRVRWTIVGGLLVTHRIADPGVMPRRGGVWNTWVDPASTAPQETLEVQAGEDLIVFGWRGDGPIKHDLLHRGPWELQLLRAAHLSPGTLESKRSPHVMPLGRTGSRWHPGKVAEVAEGRLRGSVDLEILGTRGRIQGTAPAGLTFAELVELFEDTDPLHSWPEPLRLPNGQCRTGFTLRASTYTHPRPGEGPAVRLTLRYWIAAGSIRSAAKLIVRLDREASAGGRLAA